MWSIPDIQVSHFSIFFFLALYSDGDDDDDDDDDNDNDDDGNHWTIPITSLISRKGKTLSVPFYNV